MHLSDEENKKIDKYLKLMVEKKQSNELDRHN